MKNEDYTEATIKSAKLKGVSIEAVGGVLGFNEAEESPNP